MLRIALLLLMISGAAPQQAIANEISIKQPHHGESLQQCMDCHRDADSVDFRAAMTKDCVECHASREANTGYQRVALSMEEVGVEKVPVEKIPVEKIRVPGKIKQKLGMVLPQFYPETRVGKQPNPMVLIRAGVFTMGSDARLSDEGPLHKVKLKSFRIDKYEVTNLQYQQFINATGRHSPQHFQNRTFPKGKIDHPVTYVSWHDANAYCEWAGKRLPSDAEWEKAARGTDGRTFPWGEEFDVSNANTPVRWQSLDTEGDTTPVGAFPKGISPYGVHDMSGNVWEWTDSWYRQYPGNKHPSENYGEQYKTLKGGSWWDCSFYQCGISAPVYNRSFFDPQTKNSNFGFRCAKDEK